VGAWLHRRLAARARRALDRVLAAGNRARQLIAEILTFSRSERTPRVAIDVGATVASAIDFCRHALTPSIELRADLPADPFYVAADESQIHQIVSNLCLNAAQAMPDGGRISVRLESDRDRDGQRWAKLRVADTGPGMDAETAARAFEPFFTTKPVGEGTGLGLAVVHGTVQALGGRIRLQTAPGRGSVFAISLPRIARTSPAYLSPVEGIPAGHGQTVFLVEPDAEIAEAVAAMLRGAGYRVTLHTAGSAALKAFSASRQTTLLVAALSPGAVPTGIELASAMRQLAPKLGVVLLASAASGPEELAAAEALPATVITKPVLRRELAAALVAQVARSRGTPLPHRAAS
jgi:CheY-like chemotaxis protein/two-component sensor histidine kinase